MNAEQLFEQGAVAARNGQHELALDALAHAIITDPNHVDAWALRGRIEHTIGRNFNALLHYDQALSLHPHRFDLWTNRGIVCGRLTMFEDAEASFRKSTELNPKRPEPHMNLAELYIMQMRIEEAEQHILTAVTLGDNPSARSKLGLIWLALGKWRRAWPEYEQRWRTLPYPPRGRLNHKPWQGERLTGKTILLYPGGGYGDEILALRFVETIKKLKPKQIVLKSRTPLMRLQVKGLDQDDIVRTETDQLADLTIDYSCELIDVAGPAHIDGRELLPGRQGYLSAARRQWNLPLGFCVGICWKSGVRALRPDMDAVAEQKSMPLEQLAFLRRRGVILVSLQKETAPAERETMRQWGVLDPMDQVADFADTASLIQNLDLVISVDTAVAHLAGALGHPVWCLVRFGGICLWMRERETTCWYDFMRLYRQTKLFDWSDQLAKMEKDFREAIEAKVVQAAE